MHMQQWYASFGILVFIHINNRLLLNL